MSRQRKRAQKRAAVKAAHGTANAVKAGNADIMEGCPPVSPFTMNYDALNTRQRRGLELWRESQRANSVAAEITASRTYWSGRKGGSYAVTREDENRRGMWVIAYGCGCPDYEKNGGRLDCKHIFAEKLRRGEVLVAGAPPKKRRTPKIVAQRRPARQRIAHDGATIRTSQRRARVAMPTRIPELLASLKRAYDRNARGIDLPPKRGPEADAAIDASDCANRKNRQRRVVRWHGARVRPHDCRGNAAHEETAIAQHAQQLGQQ